MSVYELTRLFFSDFRDFILGLQTVPSYGVRDKGTMFPASFFKSPLETASTSNKDNVQTDSFQLHSYDTMTLLCPRQQLLQET